MKSNQNRKIEVCMSAWDIPALELPDRAEEIWPVKRELVFKKPDQRETTPSAQPPPSPHD